jgi:hypothetical protein
MKNNYLEEKKKKGRLVVESCILISTGFHYFFWIFFENFNISESNTISVQVAQG